MLLPTAGAGARAPSAAATAGGPPGEQTIGNVPAGHSPWRLFAGCWLVYGVTLLLGALPYRNDAGMLLARAVYPVCTFLCSGPLWVFCRRVWRLGWSWPRAMLAAAALCYPLGYVSTVLANGIGNLRASPPMTASWLLLSGFGATSPCCMLVVWCGLYFGLRQHERSARVEALARTAELRALRHQLTPHFLCNTLNGISTLVGEGRAQEARRMIASLGDFLRTTLDNAGALEVSVAQEIGYLRQYLAIEQARLGEKLEVEIVVSPDAQDAGVPNLLLQPLVENAVQHGIVPFRAGGGVTIRAERRRERVTLTVRNRSHGPSSVLSPATSGSGGRGLQNTAERLRLAYGASARVTFSQDDARSWTATVDLPFHPCPKAASAPVP